MAYFGWIAGLAWWVTTGVIGFQPGRAAGFDAAQPDDSKNTATTRLPNARIDEPPMNWSRGRATFGRIRDAIPLGILAAARL